MNDRIIIAMMVENNAGVLSRISMLFGRRGFNIDSLTVSATNNPGISRITVTTRGDDHIVAQIMSQTQKLVEVLSVRVEKPAEVIQRELLLLKLEVCEEKRNSIIEVCNIYKASIVDLSKESLIVELTGKPSKIDAFLDVVKDYRIIEQCRTGVTTMERGSSAFTFELEEMHNA